MERQEGTTLLEIRKDHIERYLLAKKIVQQNSLNNTILDVASGVGYGSFILAETAKKIISIEINKDAHEKAKKNFSRDNIDYINLDIFKYDFPKCDLIVCFEFLEHIVLSERLIQKISQSSDKLLISTPNELVRPYKQHPINPFHIRHWSPEELEILLLNNSFLVKNWFSQGSGKQYQITNGNHGKFIIAYCEKI